MNVMTLFFLSKLSAFLFLTGIETEPNYRVDFILNAQEYQIFIVVWRGKIRNNGPHTIVIDETFDFILSH